MSNKYTAILGRWEITDMDQWDKSYIDLIETGFIEFDPDESGEFRFGTVHGWLFFVIEQIRDIERISFTWEGYNDSDPGCGRGWVELEKDALNGHIFIHAGDNSAFHAEKMHQ